GDIKEAVERALSDKGGEIMPTIADSLREEGRKQGLQQGLEQGLEQGMEQGMQQGIQQGIQQGMQQGVQQGIIQTAREAVIDSLEARFDVVSESMIKTIEEINDPSILKILLRKAVKAGSLDEFTRIVQLILQ
ncbi:MAG: hypothetical protein AB1847_22000, partial [bacterium]